MINFLFRSKALLFTCNPPGNTPSVWQPRHIHSFITDHMFSKFLFVSSSGRHALSFSITTSETARPVFLHQCNNCSEVSIGNGNCTKDPSCSSSPSFTTKPPPMEYKV